MKGFKAFEKGLVCRGYQYKENEVFKEDSAKICETGFHFCTNPLDTLDYYPLIDDNGDLSDFATVEALDETKTDDKKKYCTRKIKIGAKLSLKDFINAGFTYIKESCSATDTVSGKKITRKKDDAVVATSGYGSKVATSGRGSQVATSGYCSQVATSGYCSQVATSSYGSKVATSGDYSKVATSGDYSQVATSGDYGKVATSGYYSQVAVNGKNSVGANIGIGGIIKAKKGCWITLAEYDNNGNPICVRSAQIDGVILKEDTFYMLKGGEFVEFET